jgi:ferric-dicitrate binding protein FerR (iron transport regulator)
MLANETAPAADVRCETAPEPSPRRRILRRVLMVVVVLLVLGLLVFAAMSGLAADPMAGT